MQRMPCRGARIPDVEPVTTHEIFGIKRPLRRLVAAQRAVERLGVVDRLQQQQRAIVREQRKAARAQRRQRRFWIEDLRMLRRLWRRVGNEIVIARRMQRFREHDRLVHRAIDVDLRQAEVRRIEIEQAKYRPGLLWFDDRARRGEEEFVGADCKLHVRGREWMRFRPDRPIPSWNGAPHGNGAGLVEGRGCKEGVRQIEIEHDTQGPE